jgi:ribokinase
MRVAVVGHVEWCEFAEVPHVPQPGEIVHATETFEEPAGGGAVAAVQLRKLAGEATLFTAFGDDETGHRTDAELREHGLRVEGRFHPEPQRRAFVHLDSDGERTITVLGPRLGPRASDDLPWDLLDDTDAVYVTAGDLDAVRQARRARTLVATPRGLDTLAEAHVELDALVSSGRDPGERYIPGDLDPAPKIVVRTLGAAGGEWETASGEHGRWGAAELPGPVRDSYGAGDSFAAGLTYGLGAGWEIAKAVELAARCGAACLTGRGPYEGQLMLEG